MRQYKIQADGTRTYEDVELFLKEPETKISGKILFKAGKSVEFVPSQTMSQKVEDIHNVGESKVLDDTNIGKAQNQNDGNETSNVSGAVETDQSINTVKESSENELTDDPQSGTNTQ